LTPEGDQVTVCEILSRIGCGRGSLLMCCDRTIFFTNFIQYSSSRYTAKKEDEKIIINLSTP